MRTLAFLMLLCGQAALRADEIVHRFEAGEYEENLFTYDITSKRFIKPEKGGLWWRYAGGKAPTGAMGVNWDRAVRGDFTLTARYEIVSASAKTGGGVGVELFVALANDAEDGIALSRRRHPKEGEQLFFGHRRFDAPGKRVSKQAKAYPTSAATQQGALRLERKNGELIASYAEGGAKTFKVLHRAEVDGADVKKMRFAGLTGGDANAELVMRLIEFRLESGAIRKKDHSEAEPPAGGAWVYWLLGLGIACMIAAIVYRRRANEAR